jgi:hypothetical protein
LSHREQVHRIAWPVTVVFTLGCGPGQLINDGEEVGSGESLGAPTSTDESSSSESETESETGDGDGDVPPPPLPEACALARVEGDAILPLDSGAMTGVRAYTLHPGDARTPARIMTVQHEIFGEAHGEYRARSFVLESPWPEGVAEVGSSLRLTTKGHGVSRLARVADGEQRFAYVWTGDPDGLNDYDTFFSVLDAEAWSVSGELEIESSTNPSFVDILRTGSGGRFVTTYTTDSYDTTPADQASGLSLGVLDLDGTPLVAATELTARAPYPGSDVRTFWAGDRIALAITHNQCNADEGQCTPHTVVLARPVAPDEHGAAVEGFEVTHVFEGLPSTLDISRAQLSTELGYTWMTWYEGDDWVAVDEHRTLRGVVLDEHGDPLPWPPDSPAPGPIAIVQDTAMSGWPTVLVSELGITVVFRNVDGFFEVRQHGFDFQPLGEPIFLEIEPGAGNYPSMTLLQHPRSLLLAWGVQDFSDISIHMVRLECA